MTNTPRPSLPTDVCEWATSRISPGPFQAPLITGVSRRGWARLLGRVGTSGLIEPIAACRRQWLPTARSGSRRRPSNPMLIRLQYVHFTSLLFLCTKIFPARSKVMYISGSYNISNSLNTFIMFLLSVFFSHHVKLFIMPSI